jgi:hypothetical protein
VPESLEAHYRTVAKAIADGRLVPLLGAGVNLCGRPARTSWRHGRYLPSAAELAMHLAERFDYGDPQTSDLVRVSEYAAVMEGSGPLYEKLHEVFDADYPPTPLHEFLATLPTLARENGLQPRYQLVLTTNYDDTLERAFRAAGESFDLVSYVAEGEERGKFLHWPPGEEPRLIPAGKANEYGLKPGEQPLSLDERSVILKLHGIVDRDTPEWRRDSFVITEDHYIDYLTKSTNVSELLPATLVAKLTRSHILFLGYGMRDWNLRVLFHRIWGERPLTWNSWAIQIHPEPIDEEFWRNRKVDILDVPLEEYVVALKDQLREAFTARQSRQ